jgi:hypothetical protein
LRIQKKIPTSKVNQVITGGWGSKQNYIHLSTIFIKEFKKPPLKNNPGEWGQGENQLYTYRPFVLVSSVKIPTFFDASASLLGYFFAARHGETAVVLLKLR